MHEIVCVCLRTSSLASQSASCCPLMRDCTLMQRTSKSFNSTLFPTTNGQDLPHLSIFPSLRLSCSLSQCHVFVAVCHLDSRENIKTLQCRFGMMHMDMNALPHVWNVCLRMCVLKHRPAHIRVESVRRKSINSSLDFFIQAIFQEKCQEFAA